MPKSPTKTPLPLAFWVIFCVFLHCVGWLLSVIHQLNAVGYLAALTLGAVAGLIWWKRRTVASSGISNYRKLFRRLRKPFPLAFSILAALAFLGGAINAPTN